MRERGQRRRAMRFAPSQQGEQRRGIARLALPKSTESGTAQSIILAQGITRGLAGKRGIKRGQGIFCITRNACCQRLGITPRPGKKTENTTGFRKRPTRFGNARDV